MNILTWLKNKSGKLPVTLAQAAGITAVVGAAGFGALSFLSSPSDTNNTFLPPSATQEQVVYVAQGGGGGQYEANGEVGSSFKAAPSRAIQLANQQAEREAQARALEESAQQSPSFGGSEAPQMQAYQLTGADLGQGLGGGQNKNANGSLDAFSTLQNQLSGITQTINNAQAQAQAGVQASASQGAPAQGASGQTAAQLASAPRNWGSGGLTRAGGGGSGSSNSFAIQDSGKNSPGGSSQQAMAQAGDAIAQAQAAMAQLQAEGGPRMRSQANFGRSEGFKEDKDARTAAARRFGNAKAELEFIRKKSAAIAKNKTNAANEGGSPFLASTKISGGLTVNGEQVTTGQSSSGDLRSNTDAQMKGIKGKLASIQENMDERKAARDDLKSWFWKALTLGLVTMVTAALLTTIPIVGYFLAIALAASTAAYIWAGAATKIPHYTDVCGTDAWSVLGWILSVLLTGGLVLSIVFGPQIAGFIKGLFAAKSSAVAGSEAASGIAQAGGATSTTTTAVSAVSTATGTANNVMETVNEIQNKPKPYER